MWLWSDNRFLLWFFDWILAWSDKKVSNSRWTSPGSWRIYRLLNALFELNLLKQSLFYGASHWWLSWRYRSPSSGLWSEACNLYGGLGMIALSIHLCWLSPLCNRLLLPRFRIWSSLWRCLLNSCWSSTSWAICLGCHRCASEAWRFGMEWCCGGQARASKAYVFWKWRFVVEVLWRRYWDCCQLEWGPASEIGCHWCHNFCWRFVWYGCCHQFDKQPGVFHKKLQKYYL